MAISNDVTSRPHALDPGCPQSGRRESPYTTLEVSPPATRAVYQLDAVCTLPDALIGALHFHHAPTSTSALGLHSAPRFAPGTNASRTSMVARTSLTAGSIPASGSATLARDAFTCAMPHTSEAPSRRPGTTSSPAPMVGVSRRLFVSRRR
jgi:hypothetical protein